MKIHLGEDILKWQSGTKKSGSIATSYQLLQREKFVLAIKFQNSVRTMQKRLYGDNAA